MSYLYRNVYWFICTGDSETCSTTCDSLDVSASDSSFRGYRKSALLQSASHRAQHRVSFVNVGGPNASRRLSSTAARRPPLPPGTAGRRAARTLVLPVPVPVADARSRHHLQQRARQRAMRSRSWHSLTSPLGSAEATHDASGTPTRPPGSGGGGGGKFRFLSSLFAKNKARAPSSPPTAVGHSATVEGRPSALRSALRGPTGSNLSRSASAGKISETARPARTVRWDISPAMDKTIAIPMSKRPKKAIAQESSV